MNEQDQKEALLKLCGWKHLDIPQDRDNDVWESKEHHKRMRLAWIPIDHNLIAEARKALTDEQKMWLGGMALDFVPEEICDLTPSMAYFLIMDLSPGQQMDLILHAAGLWRDS